MQVGKNLSLLFVVLLCATLCSQVHAASSRELIQMYFDKSRLGASYFPRIRNGERSLELCFDQCDEFLIYAKSKSGLPESKEFWDFVFSFENKIGVGSDHSAFGNASAKTLDEILDRYRTFCKRTKADDGEYSFECNWTAWAQKIGIRVGSVIYDEGNRCLAWRRGKAFKPGRYACSKSFVSPW